MQKYLGLMISSSVLLLLVVLSVFSWHLRERYPELVELSYAAPKATIFLAGANEQVLRLPAHDTFTDLNGDGQYQDYEPFQDLNKNEMFDPLYLAGFGKNRPASGLGEPLAVRALVLDDGEKRVAFVVADVIGLFRDEVFRLRRSLGDAAPDYIFLSATHTHSAPDVIGLWGPNLWTSGKDPHFMAILRRAMEDAVLEAMAGLEPVSLRFAKDVAASGGFIEDVRKPYVIDPALHIMQAVSLQSDKVVGSLINWALHPEALEKANTLVSSDFVHYLRQGFEDGVGDMRGVGGISLFINGAVGGLMTVSDSFKISSLADGKDYLEPGQEKIQALGESVALLALASLSEAKTIEKAALRLEVGTYKLPIANKGFKLMMGLGILDRGLVDYTQGILAEVGALKIGPASFLSVPGEAYPETFVGGPPALFSADYPDEDSRQPLREAMSGDYRFVLGLTGGFLGYLIPKNQWDVKPPYLDAKARPPYGEVNSLGSDAEAAYYQAARKVLGRISD